MKKTEIACRILNRPATKGTRSRDVDQRMYKCGLRNEGNGKWSILLDTTTLSAGEIDRLRLMEWPPPASAK